MSKARPRLSLNLLALLLLAISVVPAHAQRYELGSAGPFALEHLPDCLDRSFAKASETCLPSELPPEAPADQRASTFVDRAIVLVYLRRWDAAQLELDRAIELRPAAGDVLHLAARMAITAHLERYEQAWLVAAKSRIADALQTAPDSPDVRATAAFLVELAGRADDAIEGYGRIIGDHPNHAFSLERRAMLHESKGRLKLALADFDGAVGADPAEQRYRRERAKVLIALLRPAEALIDLNSVLDRNPKDFGSLVTRASVHRQLNDNKSALEDLNSLIYGPKGGMPFATGGEQLAGFLMQRAMVLAELGRPEEAAEDMLKAVTLGGKQKILRLQVYLRQRGFPDVALDGASSDALSAAVRACFAERRCTSGLARDA